MCPLILGADKKRLSKRHGATSVLEYERQGYLPEAMVNFLALLGWSPGDDRELFFDPRELVPLFSLDGISGGNAVFNTEKLDWMNSQHIMHMATPELARRVEPLMQAARRLARRVRGRAACNGCATSSTSSSRAPSLLPELIERGRSSSRM